MYFNIVCVKSTPHWFIQGYNLVLDPTIATHEAMSIKFPGKWDPSSRLVNQSYIWTSSMSTGNVYTIQSPRNHKQLISLWISFSVNPIVQSEHHQLVLVRFWVKEKQQGSTPPLVMDIANSCHSHENLRLIQSVLGGEKMVFCDICFGQVSVIYICIYLCMICAGRDTRMDTLDILSLYCAYNSTLSAPLIIYWSLYLFL